MISHNFKCLALVICHNYQCVRVKINKEDTIAHQKRQNKISDFTLEMPAVGTVSQGTVLLQFR